MSQQTDSKPPPGECPVFSQSQSDPQSASPSGAFFMNASHFRVHGGAFNHANGDMHNNITTNNDSSTRSDFNNNNTGANRYRGSHIRHYFELSRSLNRANSGRYPDDFRGSYNHNGDHEDFRGGTNTAYYLAGQHAGVSDRSSEGNLDADNAIHVRGQVQSEPQLSIASYRDEIPEPSITNAFHFGQQQGQIENLSAVSTGNQDHYEYNGDHNTSAREILTPANTGKGKEFSGAAQLRQCVEKLLANLSERRMGNSLTGLADALIKVGWDREGLCDAVWGDVEHVYKGTEWKPPIFTKLRKICKDWEQLGSE
ncbi:hypothetical protein F5878DRAFT_637209 [Lentinula raphanica]|uniref:Uncharacterized protein n=1 Tax=Lentinula raphanica TaxID=153919 RepID=A0AA38PKE1_9AGAR|nr:hypothetical protein F5878DRAFT_637209 [Lentinula raphanica]